MANHRVEEQTEQLGRLCGGPPEQATGALRKALGDRVNLVVAKAAKVAAEIEVRDLVPDLLRAFDRLMESAATRDPQCWGKNAIAKALVEMGHLDSAPFVRGLRHIQMEKVWGGQEDTAQVLRGTCLLALVACDDVPRERVMRLLVDALTDPAATVRVEAVRALEQMGGDEAALLLRLKAAAGDREARVIGQVFDSLLGLEGEGALDFLGRFLAGGDGLREEAALSLGASRLPAALDRLRETWERERDPRFRPVLLRAIGMSREPRAIGFLKELAKDGGTRDRADALEALALHGDSTATNG